MKNGFDWNSLFDPKNLNLKNPVVILVVCVLLGCFFLFTSTGKFVFSLAVVGFIGYQVIRALLRK
jgi:hypothetical protein